MTILSNEERIMVLYVESKIAFGFYVRKWCIVFMKFAIIFHLQLVWENGERKASAPNKSK